MYLTGSDSSSCCSSIADALLVEDGRLEDVIVPSGPRAWRWESPC